MISHKEFLAERSRKMCELAATNSVDQIAAECQCSIQTVRQILRAFGLNAVRKKHNSPFASRNQALVAAYEAGTANSTEIAKANGLTRERVCQILRPHRVIEKRLERKRLVLEALSEEGVRLKQEIKSCLETKFAPGFDLVKKGYSFRAAAMKIGIQNIQEQRVFALACKNAGFKVNHSRWADFSERERRCEELAARGLSISQIVTTLRSGGDPLCHENWIRSNMPHLIKNRSSRTTGGQQKFGSAT